MISQWQRDGERPRILLHSCCAPCSTYTLEFLTQYADIAIYFRNPNIHPKNEYLRRAKVQEQFVKDFNSKTNSNVEYIEAEYKPHEFMKMAKEKGLTDEPEGGLRCSACFEMRLEIVAQAAVEYGYDYFGSAITLSPKKNAQLINELEWMFKIFIMLNICLVILKRIKDTNVQLKCAKTIIFLGNAIVVASLLQ